MPRLQVDRAVAGSHRRELLLHLSQIRFELRSIGGHPYDGGHLADSAPRVLLCLAGLGRRRHLPQADELQLPHVGEIGVGVLEIWIAGFFEFARPRVHVYRGAVQFLSNNYWRLGRFFFSLELAALRAGQLWLSLLGR